MTGRKTHPRVTYTGKALTEKRLQMGLSQQKISSLTGLSLRVYQRLESGEMEFRDLRMKYGLALCTILKLDPYIMVYGHGFTCGVVLEIEDLVIGTPHDSE